MILLSHSKIDQMKELKTFLGAILAGIFISLGGFAYLKLGGLAGAVMFAFGLLSIVHYKLPLFTGRSGFVNSIGELAELFTLVLIGNVIGCTVTAFTLSPIMGVTEPVVSIYMSRMSRQVIDVFLLAIPCGLIMTTVVDAARSGKYIPLLFGVPLFIVCGFVHSIADTFYYLATVSSTSYTLLFPVKYWFAAVVGNFIGCNIPRLLVRGQESLSS